MATFYATQYAGTSADGTMPPAKKDGRVIGAKVRKNEASKDLVNILAVADKLYIGQIPPGSKARQFIVNTGTSFGTTTISIGTLTNPTKYVNAATVTTANLPIIIGPTAAAAALAPLAVAEDLYATIGVAAIPAAVVAVFETEYTISR